MTTSTNYSDRISTPTFETQDEINQFTDGFESQANKERVEIEIEIDRKLRDETREARSELINPNGDMYGEKSGTYTRKKIQRNVLPERRVDITERKEVVPTKFAVSNFRTIEQNGIHQVKFNVGDSSENTQIYQGSGNTIQEAIVNAIQSNRFDSKFAIKRVFGCGFAKIEDIETDDSGVRVTSSYATINQLERRINCETTTFSANPNPDIAFCEAAVQAFAEVRQKVIEARETR
jgi:hypothetical protein